MKKWVSVLLAILILCAAAAAIAEVPEENQVVTGDIIIFGSYEQDDDPENGPEPIEWIVLEYDEANHKALLLSRCGLDVQPYNTEYTDVTWETCTLRTWLNSDFLNAAFSAEEQSAILTTAVDNSDAQGNSEYDAFGGNDTEDLVFLLSFAEANRYLENRTSPQAIVVPTAYAIAGGADTYDDGTASGWLLRSPGYEQDYVATFGSFYYGCSVDDGTVVIRPALWLDLESGIF